MCVCNIASQLVNTTAERSGGKQALDGVAGSSNWAIFEPPKDASPLVAGEDEPIDPEDPDFRAALELLDAGADIHGESRRAEMTSLVQFRVAAGARRVRDDR